MLNPAGIYLLKVNNRNTRTRCEMCSKLTIKTPERRQWRRPGVFIVNFEHISHPALVFLLLTLNIYLPAGQKYEMTKIGRNWVFSERTFDLELFFRRRITQQKSRCSKLKKEILQKGVKYVDDVVLVSLLLILNILHTF